MSLLQTHRVVALSSALMFVTGSFAHAQITSDSLRISGFVETSVQHASADQDGLIVGSLYVQRRDQFSLNAFEIGIDRPIVVDRAMAGFTARLLYGASATNIHAAGLDIGPQADLVQAFVTLNRPTRSGSVQLSAGKFGSMMGLEVIESSLNPNLSVGNQFIFLEDFTHVGIDANWNINPIWAMRMCVVNGWDLAVDNNTGKTAMGRVTWAPRSGASVALIGYVGPERSGNDRDLRKGGEVLATTPLGPTTATVQIDAGSEDGIEASWWGAGVWWSIPVGRTGTLALRSDVMDDADGARTSGVLGYPTLDGQRLESFTATLNCRPASNLIVRPELRYDHSSRPVFDGAREQVTMALGMALMF